MSNTDNTQIQDQATQTSKEVHMNTLYTHNTEHTLNALIDRTLAIVDEYIDRSVGDMNVMQAMEFVGTLMDMRERQQAYQRNQSQPTGACGKVCVRKPKRM